MKEAWGADCNIFPEVLRGRLYSSLLQITNISWKGACVLTGHPSSRGCRPGSTPCRLALVVGRAYVHGSHRTVTNRKIVINKLPSPRGNSAKAADGNAQSFHEIDLLLILKAAGFSFNADLRAECSPLHRWQVPSLHSFSAGHHVSEKEFMHTSGILALVATGAQMFKWQ